MSSTLLLVCPSHIMYFGFLLCVYMLIPAFFLGFCMKASCFELILLLVMVYLRQYVPSLQYVRSMHLICLYTCHIGEDEMCNIPSLPCFSTFLAASNYFPLLTANTCIRRAFRVEYVLYTRPGQMAIFRRGYFKYDSSLESIYSTDFMFCVFNRA